ncbi:MAG: hypothetical protein RL077_3877 [Verrucomicrobiota bacterium]
MPNAEHVILRELLDHETGWVSGAALAGKLGISRVAVWQHMEKLRAAGFTFTAQRSRGYRLTGNPPHLYSPLIETQLKAGAAHCSLKILDEVDSTNDEAARQLAKGQKTPFAVLARRQTQGRGRFGRVWNSESPGNLYASFVFHPQLEPARMQTFTLWMGVNICELIANFTHIEPSIKWPNDILFKGRKAGGMLTEARVDADQIRDLIFGLGLNVNQTPTLWPSDLQRRAITLEEVTGGPLDINRLTAALVGRVLLAYNNFVEGTHLATFADLWHRFDVLRGKPICLLEGPRQHRGIVSGIDNEGALLLRDTHGKAQRFRAGEVTIEKSS